MLDIKRHHAFAFLLAGLLLAAGGVAAEPRSPGATLENEQERARKVERWIQEAKIKALCADEVRKRHGYALAIWFVRRGVDRQCFASAEHLEQDKRRLELDPEQLQDVVGLFNPALNAEERFQCNTQIARVDYPPWAGTETGKCLQGDWPYKLWGESLQRIPYPGWP